MCALDVYRVFQDVLISYKSRTYECLCCSRVDHYVGAVDSVHCSSPFSFFSDILGRGVARATVRRSLWAIRGVVSLFTAIKTPHASGIRQKRPGIPRSLIWLTSLLASRVPGHVTYVAHCPVHRLAVAVGSLGPVSMASALGALR